MEEIKQIEDLQSDQVLELKKQAKPLKSQLEKAVEEIMRIKDDLWIAEVKFNCPLDEIKDQIQMQVKRLDQVEESLALIKRTVNLKQIEKCLNGMEQALSKIETVEILATSFFNQSDHETLSQVGEYCNKHKLNVLSTNSCLGMHADVTNYKANLAMLSKEFMIRNLKQLLSKPYNHNVNQQEVDDSSCSTKSSKQELTTSLAEHWELITKEDCDENGGLSKAIKFINKLSSLWSSKSAKFTGTKELINIFEETLESLDEYYNKIHQVKDSQPFKFVLNQISEMKSSSNPENLEELSILSSKVIAIVDESLLKHLDQIKEKYSFNGSDEINQEDLIKNFIEINERYCDIKKLTAYKNYFLNGIDNYKSITCNIKSMQEKNSQAVDKCKVEYEELVNQQEALDRKKHVYKNTLIVLRQNNLVEERTEAIVNPANSLLQHEGGAAKAIAEAAGPEFHQECKEYIEKYKQLGIGEAMTTSAGGNLKCRYVIHTVGPDMRTKEFKNNPGKAQAEVRKCMKSIIDQMDKHKINSVSIPAISTGIFKFPIERCAAVLGNTIKDCVDHTSSLDHKQVVVCNFDSKTTDTFEQYFFDQIKETVIDSVTDSNCSSTTKSILSE